MPVMIVPIPDSVRLRVAGDIKTILTVPYDDDDRFLLCFSDGTLMVGRYNESLQCAWEIAREGTGAVHTMADILTHDGQLEWVTAAIFDGNVVTARAPQSLPLFPHLDRYAA